MAAKELTIIHHPTHCEFFIDDKEITLNRAVYHKHLFRYQKVTLVISYEDFMYIPIRNLLLIKLFSRNKTLIQNALSEERSVTILFIFNFIFKYLLRMVCNSVPSMKSKTLKYKLFFIDKIYFSLCV